MGLPLHKGLLQIFDVDHGQCALLTIPHAGGAYFVLIDSGHAANFQGSTWYPGRHLASLGVRHIDMLVCTNYDEDHTSGFLDLAQQGFTIKCLLGNPTVPADAIVRLKTEDGMGPGIRAIANVLAARARQGIVEQMPVIPGVRFDWVCNRYPGFEDENNLSLVFTVEVHGVRFLFPGDLETAGFRNILQKSPAFAGSVSQLHVLIASHHGRANGISPEMFDEYGCRPQLVVISDDVKRYDTQETTAYYASKTSGVEGFRGREGRRHVLTTRSDGAISFSFREEGCVVF